MKIGLVTPAWPGTETANGITTAVFYLARGLQEAGHSVVILPFSQDGSEEDIPVVPLSRQPWRFSQRVYGKLARYAGHSGMAVKMQAARIAETVQVAQRQYGLDVVVIEETHGWAGYMQRQSKIPVVVTLHCPWFMQRGLRSSNKTQTDKAREGREAAAICSVAGITAPSHNVLEATRAEMHLPADIPQAIIHNPISLPMMDKASLPDYTDGSDLLFVGRFDRLKGGDTVLAAFALLAAAHATATLTFVGPDRGLISKNGVMHQIDDVLLELAPEVRSRINYLGQRSASEIAELRGRHAVTVIASRYETLGYTMLEGMAHGAALVATDVGGPAEVLRNEETALLVPPDDPEAMAAACKRLLDDPAMASRLGRAAQDVVRKEFQPKAVGEKMAAFLEQVVERHTR